MRSAVFEVLREGRTPRGMKIRLVKAHDLRGDVVYATFFFMERSAPEKYWDQRGSGYDLQREIARFENIIKNR